MEKEILEQVHRNITLNQAKNFNILQEQQEYLIKWRNEEFKALDKMKNTQGKLLNQMEKIRRTHAKSADQIQLIFDALVLLQNQTEAVISTYNNLVKYHVGEVQNQLNQLVNRQESEIDYVMSAVYNGLQRINHNIEEMVTIQQEALQSCTHSKDMQKEYLEAWTQSIIDVNGDLNNFLNESLENVKALNNDISSVHQQIKVITSPFERVLNVLSNFYIVGFIGLTINDTGVQQIVLNIFMYGSLLYISNARFQRQPLYIRAAIMATTSTVLHITLKQIIRTAPLHSWSIKMIVSAFIHKAGLKFETLHGNVEIKNLVVTDQDGRPEKSVISKGKDEKTFKTSNSRPSKQLKKAPSIRSNYPDSRKKEDSCDTEETDSANNQPKTYKRQKNVRFNEENQPFPVYQFHKYYHTE
ncbi:unnamed protein product [Mucor hiemalis]